MTPHDQAPARPSSVTDVFVSFTLIALQGFGGVQVVVQREIVEKRRWLSREEFVGDWAVAQIMPGANVVNLSLMIGGRYFGARGAIAAMTGLLFVPGLILVALAMAYVHFSALPQVAGMLRGVGAVTAGIVFATAVKLVPALRTNVLARWWCGGLMTASFVLLGLLRLPLFAVLAVLGAVGISIAWRRLRT
jgi:chromate transporter